MPDTLVHYNCPNCGSMLIVKDGQYGKFLACPRFPECRYTKALWTVNPSYGKPTGELIPICNICNGTGLIPFEKNGRIIPNAWIDCECKKSEVEHYRDIRPEDFDYPMSDTFRGFSYQYCNVVDPAERPKSIIVREKEVIPQKIEVIYRYAEPVKKKSIKYTIK